MTVNLPKPTHSYQTPHSPRGANAHFSLGLVGRGGGFGLQQSAIAEQDVFIGFHRNGKVICLPFCQPPQPPPPDPMTGHTTSRPVSVELVPADKITRTLGWGTDCWETEGIRFTIATPVSGIPDPQSAPVSAWCDAITPAIPARLTVDNRTGKEPIQGFFAVGGWTGCRLLADETGGDLAGVATIAGYGFAYDPKANPNAQTIIDFDLYRLFGRPYPVTFRLGPMGGFIVEVPAGEMITVDFILGWYLGGAVTQGAHHCVYAYTRFFTNFAEMARYAVTRIPDWFREAEAADQMLSSSNLNDDQKFMIAQATRTYYTSSMLFLEGNQPRWVINEGSFMMMNTFDLTVDMQFFELRQHPWVVRNVLDAFTDEYSYYDQVHFPDQPQTAYPGGISFTHDQGIFNTYSPHGFSTYEVAEQHGVYSYMTHEQLVNYILTVAQYHHATQDDEWLIRRKSVIDDCLESLLNRDHPDPTQRDGIMDLESNRCGSSTEITTYDSLDPSLGQSRRNLYLGVKSWAAYLSLRWLFNRLKSLGALSIREADQKMRTAAESADRCARTILSYYDPKRGYIPALLDGKDTSPIIPAIEGLIFPFRLGLTEEVAFDGPYGELLKTLRQHILNILKPGVCLFPDHGWKLSANSINSWMSKIALCQYICRQVLKIDFGDDELLHDRAHADWWRVGSSTNPGIDQIFNCVTGGYGFHYPRAVTTILWLDE